jgi:hypothetical protein
MGPSWLAGRERDRERQRETEREVQRQRERQAERQREVSTGDKGTGREEDSCKQTCTHTHLDDGVLMHGGGQGANDGKTDPGAELALGDCVVDQHIHIAQP